MGENNTISLLVKRDLKDFSTTIIYKERHTQKKILNSYLVTLHPIVNKPSHTEGKHKSKHSHFRPGWCVSMEWVSSSSPKVAGLISSSGHMPRLRAQSPGQACRGQPTNVPLHLILVLLSLSLSLLISLKISQ